MDWSSQLTSTKTAPLIAEIDDGDQPSKFVPDWLDVVDDVSEDESWTGVNLAR